MHPKMISAALGAWAILAGTTCLAALSEVEQGYVHQLATGGPITIRSIAQSLFNSGNTNTGVLDVAAEVLLEKYPSAGENPDAVDAMAWVCRALGKSGNSRYRPVLERVEKDKSVHRKLRDYCEKGAEALPREVSDAYVAGTVNLTALRNEFAAPAARGTDVATAAPAAASVATVTGGSIATRNPPPAHKLQGYAGYELRPVTLSDEASGKKNVDKVVAKIDEHLQLHVAPILKEWNSSAASGSSAERILIEPYVVGVHKPSGANRFFAGAFGGTGYVVMKVKISEQLSGKLIAEPEFYRRANAIAGAWTFGAHDNAMMPKIASLLANYLTANYTVAAGGETGWEP